MTLAWPFLLWLLLLPAALLLRDLLRRAKTTQTVASKIIQAEATRTSLTIDPANASSRLTPRASRLFLVLGLSLAIFALARPQWGRIEEPVFDQAREIILSLDLSRSMLAPDVKPSRLERGRLLITSLLEKLKGERVGLVVFSGTAFLQSPLSTDYEILREFLPALNPEFLPAGGTNYRALLQTALESFGDSSAAADRYLIILSDGEDHTDDWKPLLPEIKKKNIRILTLGIGTTEGAMIPDGSGGLVKDERGAVVLSKLATSTLQQLAAETNGRYADASSWVDLAALIQATVESGLKGEFKETSRVRLNERFQLFLAPALLFLLISYWREFPVRPKPRQLTAPSPATTPNEGAPLRRDEIPASTNR